MGVLSHLFARKKAKDGAPGHAARQGFQSMVWIPGKRGLDSMKFPSRAMCALSFRREALNKFLL
jgi:hypothetical protein